MGGAGQMWATAWSSTVGHRLAFYRLVKHFKYVGWASLRAAASEPGVRRAGPTFELAMSYTVNKRPPFHPCAVIARFHHPHPQNFPAYFCGTSSFFPTLDLLSSTSEYHA